MLSNHPQQNISSLQQPSQRRVPGRPFKPGESGCPGGGIGTRKRLRDELIADLGRELSAMDRVLLDQAVDLVMRSKREKDNVTRVRIAGRVDRILTKLRNPRPQSPPQPDDDDLQAYLARVAIEEGPP